MSTNDTEAILKRIERENQRLRRQMRLLALGLAITLALLIFAEATRRLNPPPEAAAPSSGEVRGTRFVITDAEGRVRAEWGLAPGAQEPHLVFYHPNGQRWAALAIAPPPGAPEGHQEAALTLHDEAGKARISLGASQEDSGLVVYDAQQRPGLALYAGHDAQGLTISDGSGPRIHLRYNQHDDAHLSELIFRDEQKHTQALLRAGSGGVSIELYRPDGETAFRAP